MEHGQRYITGISRGVTSTLFFLYFFYLSKSNSSQNYSSKSKSTDSKKLLKDAVQVHSHFTYNVLL